MLILERVIDHLNNRTSQLILNTKFYKVFYLLKTFLREEYHAQVDYRENYVKLYNVLKIL